MLSAAFLVVNVSQQDTLCFTDRVVRLGYHLHLNWFENTRRNSDRNVMLRSIKTIKSTNINIQTLTIVNEREVDKDED